MKTSAEIIAYLESRLAHARECVVHYRNATKNTYQPDDLADLAARCKVSHGVVQALEFILENVRND